MSSTAKTISLYDALTNPRSVALIGASDNPSKTTGRAQLYLRRSGWKGDLYPVNPTRDTVGNERAYPSVGDLPVVPDHAYIMTGADLAVEAVAQCAALGVPVVTVMADDFVGTGQAATRRANALREVARTSSTRILGPSSLGIVNVKSGLFLTASAAFAEPDLHPGDIFVASQSGSAMGALVSRGTDMGIGFHTLVSTGGELDLSLGELCRLAVRDPSVASFALFMENISHSDDLRQFALEAAALGKPIVVYKLGRSNAGAELAVSHTGALAGDDAVASALFRDLGMTRVTNFDALLESQLLVRQHTLASRPIRKPRIGVLSTTGGGGAMIVDCVSIAGGEPTAPSPDTVKELAEMGVEAGHGALIDLTLAGTRPEVMKGALEIVLKAPEFDAIVAIPGASARFHPELAVQPIADVGPSAGKPLAAFVMPSAPAAMDILRAGGISAFRTPEACAEALVAMFDRRLPTARATTRHEVTGVELITLDELESYAVFDDLGLRHAACCEVDIEIEQPSLNGLGPAVVKILSADFPHKSDVGGVIVGVNSDEELRSAITTVVDNVHRHAPDVPVSRVLVQRMTRGVGEVLIGFRVDPEVGPVVVLAAGGVLAELYHDRCIRTAPVDLDTARDMIDGVTALRALKGYRGSQRGDLDALAHAVVALSHADQVGFGTVVEAEANPVIVLPEGKGVVAVDALVRVSPADRTD